MRPIAPTPEMHTLIYNAAPSQPWLFTTITISIGFTGLIGAAGLMRWLYIRDTWAGLSPQPIQAVICLVVTTVLIPYGFYVLLEPIDCPSIELTNEHFVCQRPSPWSNKSIPLERIERFETLPNNRLAFWLKSTPQTPHEERLEVSTVIYHSDLSKSFKETLETLNKVGWQGAATPPPTHGSP